MVPSDFVGGFARFRPNQGIYEVRGQDSSSMKPRRYWGAALLASATLLLPAAAAVPASATTPPVTPPVTTRSAATGGDGMSPTRTPTLIRTRARVIGSDPAVAARRFLAGRRDTFHIADPVQDLRTVSTASEDGVTTVRLSQRYRDIRVVGAQYVVRMRDRGASNVVTGTSGRYFSALSVDVSHPLGFRFARLAALHALSDVRWKKAPVVSDAGNAIVPVGPGILTRHVTVTGYDLGRRRPVRQQLYIHAHTGKPVLSFNDLAYDTPVETTGPSVNGGSVPLRANQTATGFELRDRSRDMFGSSGGEILTRDAKGADVFLFLDQELPPRIQPAFSKTIPFPASPKSGTNDAHYALGQVYEFYKGLGRTSIDGHGGSINAVVGVTDFGAPFPNAFWNGSYMVFGGGGFGFKPFGAALDVVGHELTHGVVEAENALLYFGQSGATNEAVADYLGNAAQNTVENIAPDDPLDGLLGDQLCAHGPRVDCFDRDLNELRTTSDFISTPDDNGGVHLNSTIISGSWWEIRHALGAAVADKLVYKTLTQYLGELDQFLDVRNATIAAAQDTPGLSADDVQTVEDAFRHHGIVDDWEQTELGVDFHPLHTILGFPFIFPRVANGSWYASDIAQPTDVFAAIFTGALTDPAPGRRFSPDEPAYFDNPDSDGTTVAWTKTRDSDGRTYVETKPAAGGPVTIEDFVEFPFIFDLRIDGRTLAYPSFSLSNDRGQVTVLKPDGTARVIHAVRGRNQLLPDVRDDEVVFATISDNQRRLWIKSYDAATDTVTILGRIKNAHRMAIADLTITPNHIVFSLDKHLRTARTGLVVMNRDGSNRHWLIKDTSARAPKLPMMTATDDAVSFTDIDIFSEFFDTHLRQIPTRGGSITQVSCSKAFKGAPASDTGTGVTWVDFSAGKSQVVNRETPVGTCG